MRSDMLRQPAKCLDREFRALGAERIAKNSDGVSYRFPDGGTFVVRPGLTPGKGMKMLEAVQRRYGTPRERSRSNPLRSAVARDGHPEIDAERLVMSHHATGRLHLMRQQARLDPIEVTDALRFPERILFSPIHESWLWVRGRVIIAAAATEDGMTLVRTILWATEDLWEQNPRPKETR